MELSFENIQTLKSQVLPRRRQVRASWWFERMRAVVDQAVSWQPVALPRAEQTFLPNIYRQPLVISEEAMRPAEQQIAA